MENRMTDVSTNTSRDDLDRPHAQWRAQGGQRDMRIIVERDDGLFEIGLASDAPGPFPTRRFAEAVAGRR
jgi:hypothetical protein